MVVIRISYHQWISIWLQIGHELIMYIGGNILHGADSLQITYSKLSIPHSKSLHHTFNSMVFIKISYLFIVGKNLHGANLLQLPFLRSHFPTIFPTKLPPALNMKSGFPLEYFSKMASVTLDGFSIEDYLVSHTYILEPYIPSEIAEFGSLPSIICEPDLNLWKEALNIHSSLHQVRKDCSCYHACQACLMSDAVNIQPLISSLRYLDISSEITEVDPLLSLIRKQLSKNPPMSAIALSSVAFPGKVIITSRTSYYPQFVFNGHYSLRLFFSMLFFDSRLNQYCIWNCLQQFFTPILTAFLDPFYPGFIPIQPRWQAPCRETSVITTLTQFLVQPIVPTHCPNQPSPALLFTTIFPHVRRFPLHFQLPQWVLCPSIRPTSWLVTYVTEPTNYSASTRDVDSDQQIMSPSGCGIHLNTPTLLTLSTYWHQQPVRCEFESYPLHVFVTRIHNDLAPQIKFLSTSVACIPYPSDVALYSYGRTFYGFQRHLRCNQPLSSSLSLSATPLCLLPTVPPLIPSKLYIPPAKSPDACIPLTPDTVSLSYWQNTLNLPSKLSAHGLVTPVAPAYSTP